MPREIQVRALLLTDVVDSTRLTVDIGDTRTADVFARIDRIARDLLREYDGREIDKTDGFLMLFDRSLDAVRYAVSLHDALEALSDELDTPVAMRAGIHSGEVVLRTNDPADVALGAKPIELDGLAKPVAARIMSLAGGGQTLLSRAASDLAERASVGHGEAADLRWTFHGAYRVKGVPDPVDIFEVVRGTRPFRAPPRPVSPASRWMWGGAGIAAGLALAIGVMFFPRGGDELDVAWFGAVYLRNGIWQGEVPVPGPEGRRVTWRQESRGGRVVGVGLVNAQGNPVPVKRADWILYEPGPVEDPNMQLIGPDNKVASVGWPDGNIVRYDYMWGEDGRPKRIEKRDAEGRVVLQASLRWTEEGVVRTWSNRFGAAVPDTESGSFVETMTLDPGGRPLHVHHEYVGRRSGSPRQGRAVAWTWDKAGLPISRTTLDAAGAPVRDGRRGVTRRYAYDAAGREVERSYETFGGVPILSETNCASVRLAYDAPGNIARVTCLDTSAKPTPASGTGCESLAIHTTDDRVETRCESAPGVQRASQHGWATSVLAFDERGYVKRRERFDLDGLPIESGWGIAATDFTSDARGRLVEVGPHTDRRGRPVAVQGACASWRIQAEAGRELERTCVDGDGKPLVNGMGWAVRTLTWDEVDNVQRFAWFGPGGEPAVHRTSGHTLHLDYNDRGQVVSFEIFGSDGEPMQVKGVHRRRVAWDARARQTSEATFDAAGRPTIEVGDSSQGRPFGYHRRELEYLDGRRMMVTRTYGPDDQPILNDRGWAVRRRSFDSASNNVEDAYFDTADRPIETVDGYAIRRYAYDRPGRVTGEDLFDAAGRPTLAEPLGYAGYRLTFDRSGNETSIVYFDAIGQPLQGEATTEQRIWDDRGRLVEFRAIGVDGRPYFDKRGASGYRLDYDAAGNEIKRVFLGPEWKPLASGPVVRKSYDAARRETSTSRHQLDGRLYFDEHWGYARVETEYDAQGRWAVRRHYDANGRPGTLRHPAIVRLTHHPTLGTLLSRAHFEEGGVAIDEWGPALYLAQLDIRGRLVTQAWRDADGQPKDRGDGTSDIAIAWDRDRDLKRSVRRTGPNETFLEEARFEYDAWSRRIRTTWHDATGGSTPGPDGCRAQIEVWGDAGLVEVRCADEP